LFDKGDGGPFQRDFCLINVVVSETESIKLWAERNAEIPLSKRSGIKNDSSQYTLISFIRLE
jgi:hypothetical protein